MVLPDAARSRARRAPARAARDPWAAGRARLGSRAHAAACPGRRVCRAGKGQRWGAGPVRGSDTYVINFNEPKRAWNDFQEITDVQRKDSGQRPEESLGNLSSSKETEGQRGPQLRRCPVWPSLAWLEPVLPSLT